MYIFVNRTKICDNETAGKRAKSTSIRLRTGKSADASLLSSVSVEASPLSSYPETTWYDCKGYR